MALLGAEFGNQLVTGNQRLRTCFSLAVLSANLFAFGEDFFNAENAKVDAENRRESLSSATLGGATLHLGVASGCCLFGGGSAALCLGALAWKPY